MKKPKNALEGCSTAIRLLSLGDDAHDSPSTNAALQKASETTYRKGLKALGAKGSELAFGSPSSGRYYRLGSEPATSTIVLKAVR